MVSGSWLWRAVDEHGFVQGILLLQRHRDTEAAVTFLTRLLGEYDVPEIIHTDQLRSDGAAIRTLPNLANVDHQQVISTVRCNNMIEQEHRATRRKEEAAAVLTGRSSPIRVLRTTTVRSAQEVSRASSGGNGLKNS